MYYGVKCQPVSPAVRKISHSDSRILVSGTLGPTKECLSRCDAFVCMMSDDIGYLQIKETFYYIEIIIHECSGYMENYSYGCPQEEDNFPTLDFKI